jgi:hypothetical protein
MPGTTRDPFAAMQEQLLKSIEQAQDASIRFASVVAEQWQQMPTPAQAIDSGFTFAGRVLELQRRYALGLVGAIGTLKPAKTG